MMNLQRSMGEDGKADFKVSLKAFVKWLFQARSILNGFIIIAINTPYLFLRHGFTAFLKQYSAIFSIKKIAREMFTKQEMSAKYFEVLTELQIDDNHHYD